MDNNNISKKFNVRKRQQHLLEKQIQSGNGEKTHLISKQTESDVEEQEQEEHDNSENNNNSSGGNDGIVADNNNNINSLYAINKDVEKGKNHLEEEEEEEEQQQKLLLKQNKIKKKNKSKKGYDSSTTNKLWPNVVNYVAGSRKYRLFSLRTVLWGYLCWLIFALILGLFVRLVVSGNFPGLNDKHPFGIRSSWYKHLQQPTFHPPQYLIGPMWACMYTFMGTSAWAIWKEGGTQRNAVFLASLCVYLILVQVGTLIFFLVQEMLVGLIITCISWGVLLGCFLLFTSRSVIAAGLLLAPLAWDAFFNIFLWKLYSLNV